MNKILLVLAMFLSHSAFAANCADRHEDEAGTLVTATLRARIAQELQKKGIGMDTEKSDFHVDMGTIEFDDTGSFAYTMGGGTIVTSNGTELSVDFVDRSNFLGPQKETGRLYYKTVAAQKGFDREGNPIAAHCTLVKADGHVQDQVYGVEVSNAVSERVLVQFTQPTPLKLY